MQKQVAVVGVVSVFKEFTETFKLYAYKNQDKCDLSIRVHEGLVMTFKLNHDEFKKLITEYDINDPANNKYGAQFHSRAGQYWFVMKKKHFDAVRITVGLHGTDFNFRVNIDEWTDLNRIYHTQMSTPQPWDNK